MEPTDEEIAVLYEQYAHIIYGRALRITADPELAADAVQETFARVIKHWSRFRGESSSLTWMYRISTNWCLNQLRNRNSRRDKLTHSREDIVGDGQTHPKNWVDAERVRSLLEDADDQTRQIVVHIYFDEMTREETAQMVGLSVPTVRRRLRGFLRRSRRALGVTTAAVILLAFLVLPS